ncbi:hypothetical protein BSKO_04443 [Bryopsis sp. KO-2023]|nr:hypothetical protein BSKO_04443 [Bryopsis sp. KO-2023]
MATVEIEHIRERAAGGAAATSRSIAVQGTPKSPRGKLAQFRDSHAEVTRIMTQQEDYYSVLKVDPTNSQKVIHWNFQRLQEIIDPEVCEDALGDAALEVIQKAYTTLTTPWKKTLYHQYLTQPHGDQTFHAWVKKGPSIPGWVQGMLNCPCGAAIGLLIFTPITLLLILIWLVFRVFAIPFRIFSKGDDDSVQEDILFFGNGEFNDVENSPPNIQRSELQSTFEERMQSNGASDGRTGGKLGAIHEGVNDCTDESSG